MPTQTFKEFLLSEMKKRSMSARELSDFLGMTHTTVNRFLDPRGDTEPSAKTLAIMSVKFDMPIDVLFTIAYPNLENAKFKDDPDALLLAKDIMELPADKRDLIIASVIGFLARSNKNSD